MDDSKLTLEKRQRIESDAMIMIQMLERDPKVKQKILKAKPQVVSSADDKEFLSKAIWIDCNEVEGRYARAARDIKVGDEILIEKPNVCALLEKFSKSHCQQCFMRYYLYLY